MSALSHKFSPHLDMAADTCFSGVLAGLCALPLLFGALSSPASAQRTQNPDPGGIFGPTRPSQPSRPGSTVTPDTGDALATEQSPAIQNQDSSFEADDRPLEIVPQTRERPGSRPIIQDGDLSYPRPRSQPRDGVIDVGAPTPILDGTDPTTTDTRARRDIDLFESPPAGFDPSLFQTEDPDPRDRQPEDTDPLLFQIEDIEPVRDDRRPRRLFRFEPYDPVGIKMGSFVLFPEVETGLRWNSNVLSSPNADSDVAYTLNPSARLVSAWSRHALEFNARATLSFFNEFDSEDDRGYDLEARGRLDFTRRSNLQGLISHSVVQESRSAIDASNAPDRTNVETQRAALTFNHRFNRLTVQLRGSLETRDFGDDTFGGVTNSNDDRDSDDWEQAVRATWEFKPTLSAFAEVGFVQREFGAPAQSDNIQRDTTGERYRVGLDFGDTSAYLRGEISIGYGIERPDVSALSNVEAFLFDANASYRFSELTTFLLNARSDIEETTNAGSAGVVTHFVGLEARHAFRRHLIGTVGGSISTREFDNTTLEESEWRMGTGLEYFMNRNMVLFGNYEHTDFDSNSPGSSFVDDEFRFGLRLRR